MNEVVTNDIVVSAVSIFDTSDISIFVVYEMCCP
jgi:hypothetical protein